MKAQPAVHHHDQDFHISEPIRSDRYQRELESWLSNKQVLQLAQDALWHATLELAFSIHGSHLDWSLLQEQCEWERQLGTGNSILRISKAKLLE